jgi:hypothetical protein
VRSRARWRRWSTSTPHSVDRVTPRRRGPVLASVAARPRRTHRVRPELPQGGVAGALGCHPGGLAWNAPEHTRSPRTVRAVVNLDGESPCNGCHFERRPTPAGVEITGQTLSKSMDTATARQPIPPPPHRIMVASERDLRQATLTPLLGRHRLIDRHLSCLVNLSVGKPKIGAGEGSAG